MGYLELIIGPMFSGKTSKLINMYNEEVKCNINHKTEVIAINYDKDTRYGANKIASHNAMEIGCLSINELSELSENLSYKSLIESAKSIYINEAQFFKNLKKWVVDQVEIFDKNIILCGLDSDFKREKFGELLDLVPHANVITKLSGTCSKCYGQSIYTFRVSNEISQEVIGTDNYIPVCRNCYNKGDKPNSSLFDDAILCRH